MSLTVAARLEVLLNCSTPGFYAVGYFIFRPVYCSTLIFSFTCTRSVDDVSTLHKTKY